MKALTWQGREKVSVDNVPDPRIEEPTDAVIQVTSTAICGSDLHLYSVLGPFLKPGDVLGHETMGTVLEVGPEVSHIQPGDRVVIPFNISCGHCWMCERGLFAQCETTQVRSQGSGAALFGYTELYGSVPGGQAEYLRVPQAQFGPIRVPEDVPDERVLYLSDILPTAWQGVAYADVPEGGTLAVLGLGPVGQLGGPDRPPPGLPGDRGGPGARTAGPGRAARDRDRRPRRGRRRRRRPAGDDRRPRSGRHPRGGRHGGARLPGQAAAMSAVGLLPDAVAKPLIEKAAVDRMAALHTAFKAVRRGGTVSISGVYGGQLDPMPMMVMFDRGITIRMGQCHVKRWIDEIWPVLMADGDPLGVESLASHRLPLDEAPEAYAMFQKKADGCMKVVLKP